MKNKLHVLLSFWVRFSLSLSLGGIVLRGPSLPAQALPPTSPAPGPEAAVTLSPFVVEDSRDSGYAARDTLAGTRTKTPLADIASQVSVFTKELMEDLALRGVEEAYMYSTNVDAYREGFVEVGSEIGAVRGVTIPGVGNRSRGMSDLTNTRDFFPTSFKTDRYNMSRMTIASGPNAILFGLGSPTGVADTSTKSAEFRNAYSFGSTYTNFDGYRLETDLNRTLVKGRLAGRFAALRENNRSFRPGTSDLSERFFGTFAFKPFAKTTIRAGVESIEQTTSAATMLLPRDFVTPWWDTGKPAFNNGSLLAASTTTAQVTAAITAQRLTGLVIPEGTGFTYVQGGTGMNADSFQNLTMTATTQGAHLQSGVAAQDSATKWSFNRPEIVDPRFNGVGPSWAVNQRGTIRHAFVEQNILKNLDLELGFFSEGRVMRNGGLMTGGSLNVIEVHADPNLYLPTGAQNPDFGRPYVESTCNASITYIKSSNARATLAYSPDFRNRPGWLRFLGHYNFGALYERWNYQTKFQSGNVLTLDNPSVFSTAARNNALDAARTLRTRYYLTPGTLVRPLSPRISDPLNFTEPLVMTLPNGEQVAYGRWGLDGAFNPPTGSRQKTDSTVVNGQGYFLRDRVLVYAGYRQDAVDRAGALTDAARVRKPWIQANGTVANMGLYPRVEETQFMDWNFSETGDSFCWGAIARPLSWLQFHYSRAENFAIQTTMRFAPYGESLPGSNGVGKDYGFSITAPGGKLMLRVNLWENNQLRGSVASDATVAGFHTGFFSIERRILDVSPQTPMLGIDLNRYGNTAATFTMNYPLTATLEGKGMDIELVANPAPSWRAMFSAGKQESRTQLDGAWQRWADDRLPVWRTFGRGWDVETITDTSAQTVHEYYNNWVAAYRDPLLATNGRITSSQRKWRANFVVTHDFRKGFMKGWTLGGGGRYRSAPYVGYPVKTLASGQKVLDLNNPYLGADEKYVDAFARYALRSVPFFGERGRAKFQVNVRNLLDDGPITVTDVKIDGSPKVYRFQAPREIIFSVDVSL
jgi:hypothetical protein